MEHFQRRVDNGDLSPSEWEALLEKPQQERTWHTDAEICRAAEITVRTLQTLQTRGFLASNKAARVNGGYRRVWRRDTVYIAAVAAAVAAVSGWSVKITADVLELFLTSKYLPDNIVNSLIADSLDKLAPAGRKLGIVLREEFDWFLSIGNRKLIFLAVPERSKDILRAEINEFPIGVIFDTNVVPIYFMIERTDETIGRIQAIKSSLARAGLEHSIGVLKINISASIRAAAVRIGGADVEYVDWFISPEMMKKIEKLCESEK